MWEMESGLQPLEPMYLSKLIDKDKVPLFYLKSKDKILLCK